MKKAFVILCLALLAIPAAGLVMKGAELADGKRDASVTENVLLRNGMVSAHTALYALAGQSTSDQVVLGKDGYLYLAETLPATVGAEKTSDEEIERIAGYLKELSDEMASRGSRLIFLCAPNKATILPEHLPWNALPAGGESALDRLQRRLEELGVAYIDAKAILSESKAYFRTDTHWNDEGALQVYRALRAETGMDAWDDYSDLVFKEAERIGDLTELLVPEGGTPETVREAQPERRFRTTGIMRTAMDQRILTTCPGGEGKLIMIRDSFANNLFPYLANNAASMRIYRAASFDGKMWEDGTDAVILEIAERNLSDIGRETAP